MDNITTFWHKAPFVRLLLCLVAGIISGMYLSFYLPPFLACVIIVSIITGVGITYYADKERTYTGFALMASVLMLGFVITRMQDDGVGLYSINNIKSKAKYVCGYICTDVDIKKGKEYAVVTVTQSIEKNDKQQKACGKMLLYIPAPAGLKYGQEICIDARDVHNVPSGGNPYEFDYATYLYRQHIYAVAYTLPQHIRLGEVTHVNFLKALAYKFNRYTLTQLKTYMPDKEARGIMEALLIGYRANIDEATVQAYTDCGVIHVMAVSGTQVALIFILLDFVFNLIKRNKRRNFIQWLVTIFFIWVFTAMAGFSGSVVRAAVMLTFVSYGRYLNRYTGMYNMLAASAFFIFLFDSYSITDVGLQLSYSAVWGIVFLNRKIYTALVIQNKILDIAWKLTSVSISAQVATLPLLLYYFHQFPLFFIPANILAIPVTTLALYAGIFMVCFGSLVPVISKSLAVITIPLIHLLDNYLLWLRGYTWAVLFTHSWNIPSACVLAILVLSAIVFIVYRYKPSFYIVVMSMLMLVSINTFQSIASQRRQMIVRLNIGHNQYAYCLEYRNTAILVCDTASVKNTYFIESYFPKYARSMGITQWVITSL